MLMANQHPFYASDDDRLEAPPLPPSVVSVLGSVKRGGRFSVPPELHLTAVLGELKLDLREALFPARQVLFVANAVCSSLHVLLPPGVTVVDQSVSVMASHDVSQTGAEHGPVIYLDGWSVCSDVKFISAAEV
jgi:hypothetical protein